MKTETECIQYLYCHKWPHGFSCPACGHWHAYTISTRKLPLYECSCCKHQTSLLAGTVMEGSRTSLVKWFHAIQLVSDPEHGISALTLCRILHVTYKTAWSMLHKIRYAMGRAEAEEPLHGQVVIHDACYGRPHNSTVFQHPEESPVVVGAVVSDDQPSRIMFRTVPTEWMQGRQILPIAAHSFIRDYVSALSRRSCSIQLLRFAPIRTKIARPLFREACLWLNQTFRGIGKKHLQTYLDEFCCRTNLALCSAPIFSRLSYICAAFGTITYRTLTTKPAISKHEISLKYRTAV
ncbi:transposase [Gorillibacterium sp. sgz5001074]|uniref:transposase n=1 Tax=Gorillibacterium sp. sgz5001074 TaxID=3446695 RepID=UPI003F67A94B